MTPSNNGLHSTRAMRSVSLRARRLSSTVGRPQLIACLMINSGLKLKVFLMMASGRTQRWAKIGITGQFAALVRILAEYFRLRYVQGSSFALADIDLWISAALIAAFSCWLAVTAYFFGWYRAAIVVSIATVVVLLVYKFAVFGVSVP